MAGLHPKIKESHQISEVKYFWSGPYMHAYLLVPGGTFEWKKLDRILFGLGYGEIEKTVYDNPSQR